MGIEIVGAEVDRIANAVEADANASLANGDFAGAKRLLTAAQKELRLLKRDAIDEERTVREAFQDQRLKVSKSGQTVGMFVSSKTRGAMARVRASEKRSLQERQNRALRPYAELKARIDRVILNIDQAKATITAAAEDAKKQTINPAANAGQNSAAESPENAMPPASTSAPPPPPIESAPTPPPHWAADPSGRYQFRYWDGQRWTAHVSTDGQTMHDPIDAESL